MTATTDDAAIARELATRLPEVVAGGDLAAILPLLSPDVRWGPDGEDTPQTCHSRDDVARWFGGRLREGLRARLVETTVRGPRILLALAASLPEDDGSQERLLVLTVRGGQVADVRAAADRDHAERLLDPTR